VKSPIISNFKFLDVTENVLHRNTEGCMYQHIRNLHSLDKTHHNTTGRRLGAQSVGPGNFRSLARSSAARGT